MFKSIKLYTLNMGSSTLYNNHLNKVVFKKRGLLTANPDLQQPQGMSMILSSPNSQNTIDFPVKQHFQLEVYC